MPNRIMRQRETSEAYFTSPVNGQRTFTAVVHTVVAKMLPLTLPENHHFTGSNPARLHGGEDGLLIVGPTYASCASRLHVGAIHCQGSRVHLHPAFFPLRLLFKLDESFPLPKSGGNWHGQMIGFCRAESPDQG